MIRPLFCAHCCTQCCKKYVYGALVMGAARGQDWLGVGRVEPFALWTLFLAFACTVIQVRCFAQFGGMMSIFILSQLECFPRVL